MRTPQRLIQVAVFVAVLGTSVGCSDGGRGEPIGDNALHATASPPASVMKSPESDRDGDGIADSVDTYPDDRTNTPPPEVTLTCVMDKDFRTSSTFTVKPGANSVPDFGQTWAAKPYSCKAMRNSAPFSALEETAYKTSGYTDHDTKTLYAICGAVDPEDVYASAGFAASESQILEINAALVLCPGHPQASAWRQAVQQGKVNADHRTAGKRFGAGTFLVGKEIVPGTYFVEGDINGCYWERQNRSGQVIENNFIIAARRVQVSIKSTDYAFHSERCGEWARM